MSTSSAPVKHDDRSPSPPPCRRVSASPHSRRGRYRGEVIVERVVKESGGAVQYPMLTRTKYQEWSLLMRVNMQARGLWHTVEPEQGDIIEYREDRLALSAILRAVPGEMLGSLARKHTARSAWEAVKTVRVGVQRVRDSNTAQLKKDFADIQFKEGDLIDDFALRIVGLANEIRVLDHPVTDAEIVKKMLQVVSDHLSQIAIAIETFLDVDTMALEEVVGRLRQVEEREAKKKKKAVNAISGDRVDGQGRLLLT